MQWAVPQLDNPLADNPKVGEPGLRAEPGDWQVAGDRLSVSRLAGGLVRTVGRAPGLVSWSGGGDSGWLAVRLPASELDLAPRGLPGLGPDGADVQSGGTPRDPEGGGLVLRTELDLTAWCLVLAILVLGLEWLLWQGALKRRR